MNKLLYALTLCLGMGLSVHADSDTTQPASTPPPVAGQPWTNSLGVKFVPAGTDGVLFSVWDVRVKDFQAYAQATGYQQTGGIYVLKVKPNDNGIYTLTGEIDPHANWEHPGFKQDPTHPVVGVSWNDATAFCQWLTGKERKEGLLGPDQAYRLPTDAEWSKAAGAGKYPWGDVWPPPAGTGNYADEAFASSLPGKGWHYVPGNDGYPLTSPVGSFRANAYGLYDMGGNVWQWCDDWYRASMNSDELGKRHRSLTNDGGGSKYKVLRGASWDSDVSDYLLTSFHFYDDPANRDIYNGFRLVLVVSPRPGDDTAKGPASPVPAAPVPVSVPSGPSGPPLD